MEEGFSQRYWNEVEQLTEKLFHSIMLGFDVDVRDYRKHDIAIEKELRSMIGGDEVYVHSQIGEGRLETLYILVAESDFMRSLSDVEEYKVLLEADHSADLEEYPVGRTIPDLVFQGAVTAMAKDVHSNALYEITPDETPEIDGFDELYNRVLTELVDGWTMDMEASGDKFYLRSCSKAEQIVVEETDSGCRVSLNASDVELENGFVFETGDLGRAANLVSNMAEDYSDARSIRVEDVSSYRAI